MINATPLYPGLLSLLDRGQWPDPRHLKTAVSMMVVIYRGRAVLLSWDVLEHASAQVAVRVYRKGLQRAAKLLPPSRRHVVLLADRGFADVTLMRWCDRLGGGYQKT